MRHGVILRLRRAAVEHAALCADAGGQEGDAETDAERDGERGAGATP